MKQRLVIILCVTVFHLSAQNKTNEINIGIGDTRYKHSGVMPSGGSGTLYSLDYLHTHRLKSNNNILFGYFADMDFSNLDRWKINYNIFDGGLDVGVFWLGHLPVKNEKISLYAGGGLLFDSDIFYSDYNDLNIEVIEAQWFLSPSVYFSGDYHLKKFNFRFKYSMPVFSAGFQSRALLYPTTFENVKMALTPNTYVFFTKRFYPKADIAVSYPVFSNDKTERRLQFKYVFEQLVYTGYPYERKANNRLELGMIWVVK